MLNMLVALLLAAAGLGGAWWNHRRLKRNRHLNFAQAAARRLLTLGSVTLGVFLAYLVAFPPDGRPIFGEGKVLKNDENSGRLGKYRGDKNE